MRRPFLALGILALFFSLAAAAVADTYGDLAAAKSAFAAATSWHADEHMPNGMTIAVDFVAPDRWRVVTPSMTELVIGSSVYMIRGGRTTAMPPMMGGMVQRELTNFRVDPVGNDVKNSARDLGMKAIGGKPAHGYWFQTHGTPVTMYLDARHLPIQSVVQTKRGAVTIVYSQWNSPISIQAP
jgi:hypothetical protein